MIHAFGVTVGILLGALFAFGCVAVLLCLALLASNRWLLLQQRRRVGFDPLFGDECPPDFFDPEPESPSRLPTAAEIESWWIPIDGFDKP